MVAELEQARRIAGFENGSCLSITQNQGEGLAARKRQDVARHQPRCPFTARFRPRLAAAAVLAALALSLSSVAHAAPASDPLPADTAALAQMEQQALSAQPREQCFLYTVVVQSLIELAGRQISTGDEEQALTTLKHLDAVLAKMHEGVSSDAKRLKNAELLIEHSSRRLSDMMHAASNEGRTAMQSTLQRLNSVHSEVLAQVFAK